MPKCWCGQDAPWGIRAGDGERYRLCAGHFGMTPQGVAMWIDRVMEATNVE
jgi:hypothetical protein